MGSFQYLSILLFAFVVDSALVEFDTKYDSFILTNSTDSIHNDTLIFINNKFDRHELTLIKGIDIIENSIKINKIINNMLPNWLNSIIKVTIEFCILSLSLIVLYIYILTN